MATEPNTKPAHHLVDVPRAEDFLNAHVGVSDVDRKAAAALIERERVVFLSVLDQMQARGANDPGGIAPATLSYAIMYAMAQALGCFMATTVNNERNVGAVVEHYATVALHAQAQRRYQSVYGPELRAYDAPLPIH